jgi:GntR family hexuronate regulon transcriptional repressor
VEQARQGLSRVATEPVADSRKLRQYIANAIAASIRDGLWAAMREHPA